MKYIIKYSTTILTGLLALTFTGCKKYLDEKPDKSITTPATLDDLESIMDNHASLFTRFSPLPELSADNFYLSYASWAAANNLHQNIYSWQKYDDIAGDWASPFNSIYYANVVLETMPRINVSPADQQRAATVRGSALFTRAYHYYAAAQMFAPAFDQVAAISDLGLPLRLNADHNETSVRSSVLQTYDQMIADLKNAIPLLPAFPSLKYRPSKPAAYAALARTYMAMQDYPKAGLYADSCLRLYDSLMDYNSISASAAIPFTQFNREVILDARSNILTPLSQTNAKIDSLLYNSYAVNDLRRTIFFKSNGNGTYSFKGNYTGLSTAALFTGVTTDEMYLLRAECFARSGNTTAAMNDLNTLMNKRWKAGTFIPFIAANQQTALQLILTERRKELLFRNLRWTDLRRLNKEPAFTVTLTRLLNNQVYTLQPGSLRYTMQIDAQVIALSGMQQNP